MQESLLLLSIEEHVFQIKNFPTDLEVHVSLANLYVSLANLYSDYQKRSFPKSFLKKMNKTLTQKFEIATKHAIEEFIIIKSFAPNDPWALSQLAKNYNLLCMLEE